MMMVMMVTVIVMMMMMTIVMVIMMMRMVLVSADEIHSDDWPGITLSKKVIKRYKVISKKCITKSIFHLKNESARFCIKDAHSSVQSRLLDDEHGWGDQNYLPRLWQRFQ